MEMASTGEQQVVTELKTYFENVEGLSVGCIENLELSGDTDLSSLVYFYDKDAYEKLGVTETKASYTHAEGYVITLVHPEGETIANEEIIAFYHTANASVLASAISGGTGAVKTRWLLEADHADLIVIYKILNSSEGVVGNIKAYFENVEKRSVGCIENLELDKESGLSSIVYYYDKDAYDALGVTETKASYTDNTGYIITLVTPRGNLITNWDEVLGFFHTKDRDMVSTVVHEEGRVTFDGLTEAEDSDLFFRGRPAPSFVN